MPSVRQPASRIPGLLLFFTFCLLLFALLTPPARAHATLEFHAVPTFAANPIFLGAPTIVHGIATAHLSPDSLTLELTLADAAAYALLNPDPYSSPANATSAPPAANSTASTLPPFNPSTLQPSSPSSDPHFDADQPLLLARAPTVYLLISNGTFLQPFATTVTITPDQNVVFHLTYPLPPPGPLRIQANDLAQAPSNQNDVITVTDHTGQTLANADLSAANPALDLTIPAPPAPVLAAPTHHLLLLVVFVIIILVGLLLVSRRRRPAG